MANKKLKIFNGFGIQPTNTYISAGTDYYIPNINAADTTIYERVIRAFSKSYGVDEAELNMLVYMFTSVIPQDSVDTNTHILNIIHLYLALGSYDIEEIRESNGNIDGHFIEDVQYFCDNYLVFDSKGVPGVCLNTNDTLFINSGIRIALNPNDAGLYVNKSGMGNKGWDVRAQLVDEDYSGYVHLSMAYTKRTKRTKPRTVFCGDKITQMMIMEVKHYELVNVETEEAYNELMQNSSRGDNGFGHSDVKH